MADRNLRALFERFREHGDAVALGAAFDASAPELMRIARHLAHDRGEAEDIVQATYLTAIEKIASLERGREPLPWLIGMLVLHAREARRRRGRGGDGVLDLDGLETRRAETPDATSERRELSQLVERAVAELPEHYRAVVAPYLDGSASSNEIAARVGRSPGVVRMQIHRALERLRRALPSGAALGFFGSHRELAALRERVLARALAQHTGASTALATGGWFVGKQVALWLAAVLVAVIGVWSFANSSAAPERKDENVAQVASVESKPVVDAAREESLAASDTQRVIAPTPAANAKDETATTEPKLTGRLLEHDSTPLAGIEVSLFELSHEWTLGPLLAEPYAPPSLEISRARTDATGTFQLGCARASGVIHLLGIDIGGPRGSVRAIDAPLVAGVAADIGDFVMPLTGSLAGRAIDEQGAPLGNVVVRAVLLPKQMQAGRIEDLLRSVAFGDVRQDQVDVLGYPEWLRTMVERVPVATVRTGADGRFEIATPPGTPVIALDCEGRPIVRIERASVIEGKRYDLGDVKLPRGRSVKARVLDFDGAPITNARVVAGVIERGQFSMFAMRPTSQAGEFELDGVRIDGELAFAALRSPGARWKTLRGNASEVELRFDPPATLTVEVLDASAQRLSDVEIELMPGSESLLRMAAGIPRAAARDYRGAGLATFDTLVPGKYALLARAKGFAPQWSDVEVVAPSTTARVTLAPVAELEVRVHDAQTGTPIADARVELRTQQGRQPIVDRATTDVDGNARVRLIPDEESSGFTLRVEHPSYAPQPAVRVAPNASSIDVALDLGATLVVHVRERGRAPAQRYVLSLGSSAGDVPLSIAPDRQGDASVARLAPGSYGYSLHLGINDQDAWAGLGMRSNDGAVLVGSVELDTGRTTELALEVDKDFSASADKGRLRGRIRLDGDPAKNTAVYLTNITTSERHEAQLAADGTFDFGWIAPGSLMVTAQPTRWYDDDDIGLSFFRDRIELAAGAERELDINARKRKLDVLLTDRSSAPVGNATAILCNDRGQPICDTTRVTGDDGRMTLPTLRDGAHRLMCYQHDVGAAIVEDVFNAAGPTSKLTVVLDPGVPCEGWLELPSDFARPDGTVSINVSPIPPRAMHYGFTLSASALTDRVRIAGLSAGRYRLSAANNVAWTTSIEFEVPAEGNRNFNWRLELPNK